MVGRAGREDLDRVLGTDPGSWGLTPEAAAPVAKKAPKPKVSKATPHGIEWAALIERYHAGFERVRGVRPLFDGADARAMQRLLEKVTKGEEPKDYARAGRIIDCAFADRWWGPKVTIRDIARDPSRFDRTTPERRAGSHMQKAARDADGSLKKPELVDLDD